jgi:uncharacterized membrane protein YdjX (TVP38/TMEM64 family)
MLFGVSGVSFGVFLAGTIIGLTPTKLALALAGDGFIRILHHPTPRNIAYMSLGVAVWLGMLFGTHLLAKRWQDHNLRQA